MRCKTQAYDGHRNFVTVGTSKSSPTGGGQKAKGNSRTNDVAEESEGLMSKYRLEKSLPPNRGTGVWSRVSTKRTESGGPIHNSAQKI